MIISNIAQMPNTSQASPEELRKSLVQQCDRLLPGSVTNISVTNISVADITSRISQGIAVFDVKPSMDLDLVPKFLILHDSKDSWLSGYTVPVPNQRGQVRLGTPYVYVAQPHYDRSNKDLIVAVRVEVLSSADDAPTHDLPAWLGKCHTAFCEKLFDEVFNARTGKLNFSYTAGMRQFACRSTSVVCVAEVHKHCTGPHLLSTNSHVSCIVNVACAKKCQHESLYKPNRSTPQVLSLSVTCKLDGWHSCNGLMPSTCIARTSFPVTHANTTRINYAQWPVSHTNDSHHKSHVVCLQIAGEGMPAHEAAFQAINSPLLQNLELHGICRNKMPGHVWLSFYSARAADKVRKAGIIELGVQNQDVARLTTTFVSQEGKALESWKFGIVSTNLPSADFASAKLLLSYFTSLCEVAMKTGKALAAKGYLSTDPNKLELNFYDKNGKAWGHKQITEANIHSFVFVPSGTCYQDISLASLRERADKGRSSGLKACFKGADAQTSSLCLFSSQLKPLAGIVGSSTLYLTSHGYAAAGRTIPPSARPAWAAAAGSRQPRAAATSLGPKAKAAPQQTQLALSSRPAPNNSAEYLARTTVMAAISVVEGRPLQADREQLLRGYTANRINQEFMYALKELPPQAKPLDMVDSPAPDSPDAFEAFWLTCQISLYMWTGPRERETL